jgi:L-2-hydroxycarboxylate dehydrogenase (NAD+)
MRKTTDEARELGIAVLSASGVANEYAKIQVNHLLEGELRGHPSHGLLRLPRIVNRIRNGLIAPNSTGTHSWQSEALLSVDGGTGLGPVVAYSALEALTKRTTRTGISVAVISHASHLCMLAQYAEATARDGNILIALTTSEALVHPWGGRHALIGTNPIAIGVPANPEPFVLDMATGVVSMGKILAYAADKRDLEEGWALDSAGESTTDAAAAAAGSIAPFGGAKGYALGLSFEVLVAALTGTATGADVHGTLDDHLPSTKGDVFIMIRPHSDSGDAIGSYLSLIRSASTRNGAPAVTVPGDRARSARAQNNLTGLDIPSKLWDELTRLAIPADEEGKK